MKVKRIALMIMGIHLMKTYIRRKILCGRLRVGSGTLHKEYEQSMLVLICDGLLQAPQVHSGMAIT